jgi:chorismate dehydratase
MLRIGCVKYLNARPLIHGWSGNVVLDHPSALCAQLARGDLDVALVSSFEFLRNPIYRIVDGISIASDGPVYSVVVAHQTQISDLNEVALDPAAETSGNLLRCLLKELNLRAQVVAESTSSDSQRASRLLIGDQAIRFRQKHANDFCFWDLGEQWKKLVGLPFVYAIWLVRPEVVDPKVVANQLRTLRDKNLAKLERVIADQTEFDRTFCESYYRDHLRFSFGEEEKRGLRKFAESCQKHELLPKRELAFSVV